MPSPTERLGSQISPFFSRSYGAFTVGQVGFARKHLLSVEGGRVLDPMAGQGVLLSELAWEGHDAWGVDLNPALVLLASLRNPGLIRAAEAAAPTVRGLVRKFKAKGTLRRPAYVDRWVPFEVEEELQAYYESAHQMVRSDRLGLAQLGQWPPALTLAVALPILAARSLACYRSSDNVTWVKQGGLQRISGINEALVGALDRWTAFAQSVNQPGVAYRSLNPVHGDVVKEMPALVPECEAIITSPPYANRLDYSRMWAPELNVYRAMCGVLHDSVKERQIGSTVIRAVHPIPEAVLPNTIINVLTAIRQDKVSKASADYYYPFFLNYANSLATSLYNSASRLANSGLFIIFVRDTARKDELFPTGDLVRHVMDEMGLTQIDEGRHVIRRHIGLRRRGFAAGTLGIAQHEWWLAFRRS